MLLEAFGAMPLFRAAVSDFARVWRIAPIHFSVSASLIWIVALTPGYLVALTALLVNEATSAASSESGDVSAAMVALGQIVAITILSRAATGYSRYLTSVATYQVTTRMSEAVMSKGTTMDLASYENPDHYDRLQRANTEAQSGRAVQLVLGVIGVVGSFLTVVSVAITLFSWNPIAAVIALICPIPAAVLSGYFGRLRWKIDFDRADSRRRSAYYQWLTTNDQAFKEVEHFRLGGVLIERFTSLVRGFFRVDRRFTRRSELSVGAVDIAGTAGVLAALGMAVLSSVRNGQVGQLAGFIQAISALQASTTAFLLGLAELYRSALYTRNLFGFLEIPDATSVAVGEELPRLLKTSIEFRNVSFTYPGTDRPVLKSTSFTIDAGSHVAIVGPNGGGKSTIVKLLCGLYQPDSGEILIDGRRLSAYTSENLRRGIGVVFQDFMKFELSAQENISFGAVETADSGAVKIAAERSGIDAKIQSLPGSYSSLLGRRFAGAQQLSIGEWQRIALARGFVSEAPIMILDEPSSALDAASEQDLVERMSALRAGVTSIVIAHRFATIRRADRIFVLEDGGITEQGTHADLLIEEKTYAAMYHLQAAHFQDQAEGLFK